MITKIEALNYRCLRYVSRSMGSFHVLVGPNASGKTTFLDVVGFLRDIASDGIDTALLNRTTTPEELLFRRQGSGFELAIEAKIPEKLRAKISNSELDTARYEVALGFDDTQRQFEFKAEKFLLKNGASDEAVPHDLFPMVIDPPKTLVTPKGKRGVKVIVNKVPGGNDNFYSEVYEQSGKGWAPSFKLGPQKSALRNLPADETAMPVANWFRTHLSSGVQQFVLNSMTIRKPSPPTKVKGFLPDGSNLPWVVSRLKNENASRYTEWIAHLQTALPDLLSIGTIERPEDKHC